MDQLFIGVYPTGLSYCDRTQEKDGDYKKVAFLDYRSLTLTWRGNCSPALQAAIKADAAAIRSHKGEQYQISSCGQTVTLGPCLHNSMVETQSPTHVWKCADCGYVY